MKLKEIHRTSTFAWSPLSTPLLATGTVAGALDESFSNDSQLEIWEPDFLNKQEYDLGGEGQNGLRGSVANSARFNRIVWGKADGSRPEGVIAAGMENGELGIWDPSKIVSHTNASDALILKNSTHTGPVRGLDFNAIQSTLFASGGINGEVYIWDLKDPSKPYSPGTRSSKLDEVSALAWNNQVPHVLATSSGTGYTVVWDLRGKREVVALAYGGGVSGGIQAGGGRRGMSDVAWHPENATRLVTSSEDDASPIVMVWDLRNARAPEKILTGHEKGVLSLSWCKQDADLLLSSGKDNRALCWNPQTSEIIGELPSADNWAFQVQWCPRNPDLLAAAFFDGTIGLHSIQSTNEVNQNEASIATPQPDGADVFDNPSFARTNQASFTLKQPPKWLCRPASASFGYCGQLVSVSNLASKEGRHQSGVVHIRKLITEDNVVARAERLRQAIDTQDLPMIATERSAEAEDTAAESAAGWKALLSLFRADSRDELVTLLGFSKAEIAALVAEAITKLRSVDEESTPLPVVRSPSEEDVTDAKPHEPVVSFAEPERSPTESAEDLLDATPSELSAGAASDTSNVTPLPDAESTTTAPSLFGDDGPAGTPQLDSAADFFSNMGLSQSTDEAVPVVPHTNYGIDSSVAATIGSRPSSAASDTLKSNTFRIYPADESKTDRLVTKALVIGDFESAVSLCLSVERFADAILLAVKGGPELLARTQKAYFEKRTISLPYLRLFQSVVTNDLADIVQNADLQDWQEIFVVLCTFAQADEFGGLAEQLGSRLEFQASLARSEHATEAPELRKNATLAYLAAGRLERLVNIWIEELAEEEKRILADDTAPGVSRYTAHAHALQTFIEKVTVFRSAASYVDKDLEQTEAVGEDAAARGYKLSGLYDRYFEYAAFLAAQGLVKHAVAFLKFTPSGYKGLPSTQLELAAERERLLIAAGVSSSPLAPSLSRTHASAPAAVPTVPAVTAIPPIVPTTTSAYSYNPYALAAAQQQQAAGPTVAAPPAPTYNSYAPIDVPPVANNPYAPAQPVQPSQPYQPTAPLTYPSGNAYNHPPPQLHGNQVAPPPPPPHGFGAAKAPPPPPGPPPKRRENGGWNDAPTAPERRTPSGSASKPAAITSPFPNATRHRVPYLSPAPVPPPPRPGSVQSRHPPPPAQGRVPVPPPPIAAAPGPYPPAGSGPVSQPLAPLNAIPAGLQPPPRQPPPGQYAPPSQIGHAPPAPPPNRYAHATPPPGAGGPPLPPPQARQLPPPATGPYAASPLQQQQHPGLAPPPSAAGPYVRVASPLQQQQQHPGFAPPPPSGPARVPPPPGGPPQVLTGQPSVVPPPRTISQGPAPPKYPPGDRTHIPDSLRPIYNIVSQQLNQLKQTTPTSQRRLVEDLERRINPLFDALNCEILSAQVVTQLGELTKAMGNHDRELALAIHIDMLTRSSGGDDITLWMSG
ncbi:hypothetical protein B0F90DRAFT_1627011 [Multifurca ochricompacta]|uniref:Protein transport protein SEC31 n=1 Tax=Multifurca ochricompacta TaxID=376703 RepID=A0AAD4QPG0_9AGAM|nr:hypothetical protein B0F90DRAFT_1627011 [Multifurca ochricompacta]